MFGRPNVHPSIKALAYEMCKCSHLSDPECEFITRALKVGQHRESAACMPVSRQAGVRHVHIPCGRRRAACAMHVGVSGTPGILLRMPHAAQEINCHFTHPMHPPCNSMRPPHAPAALAPASCLPHACAPTCAMHDMQVDVQSHDEDLVAAAVRFVPSLPQHHLALMQEIGGWQQGGGG